jgi:putative ABC transport system substrate-binding protein
MRRREFLFGSLASAAWSQRGLADGTKLPRLAVVNMVLSVDQISEGGALQYRAFYSELKRLGLVENQSIKVERWSALGRADEYADLARRVVASKPDVIFITGSRFVLLFRAETSSIPIVANMIDPVGYGVAASLSHPGGNVTGVSANAGLELVDKTFEILRRLAPNASRIALLQPSSARGKAYDQAIQQAALRLGLSMLPIVVESPHAQKEYQEFFRAATEASADAVMVADTSENLACKDLVAALAAMHQLPAIYPNFLYAETGALVTYGYSNCG